MSAVPGRTVCSACGRVFSEGERFCPFDRADLRPEWARGSDPLVGTELGGSYTILAKLGSGGMGVVYRARQNRLQRDVAVKILSAALAADKAAEERFRTEALAVSQLSNAHTVGIFDFGATEDGRVYIVMQLLEGESLRARLQRGSLSIRSAVTIAAHIAESLSEAHDKRPQIMHRDVKPDNVFVRRSPEGEEFATVLDFGLAKLADTERMTATGLVIGTPAYMAPEQAKNEERLDARLDLYALGVVLYEMLAGRPPFAASSAAALLYKHVWDPPPPLAETRPGLEIPPVLEHLVFELLAKSPDARPATAGITRTRLLEIQRQLPDALGWDSPAVWSSHPPQATIGVSALTMSPAPAEMAPPPGVHDTPLDPVLASEDTEVPGRDLHHQPPSRRVPLIIGAVVAGVVVALAIAFSSTSASSSKHPSTPLPLGGTTRPAETIGLPPVVVPPPPPAETARAGSDLPLTAPVDAHAPVKVAAEHPADAPASPVDAKPTSQPDPKHSEKRGHARNRPPPATLPDAAPATKPAPGGDFPIVPM